MAKILWLNWSGGGNLPPSLGIARVLTERGHQVTFAGRPEMVSRVERAGFRAIELTRAYEQLAAYPADKWIPTMACYLTSPATGEQVREVLEAEQPDLVIVDHTFMVAFGEAARYGRPTVVVCNTSINRMRERWRGMMTMMNGLRMEAGFATLPTDLDGLWMSHDRLIATTLASLDEAPGEFAHAHRVRHVGPALERERHSTPIDLPWPADDPTPLVLVSYSTAPEQRSVAKFQTTIDALAELPVHAVMTLGDGLDVSLVTPAPNVHVVRSADHDQIMDRASLVLTHGGHGTLMRALSHGLPMVVIPGLGGDQPPNAAAVQGWGCGLALPGDADRDAVREAVRQVLATPAFAAKAREIAKLLEGVDGAVGAADEMEQVIASRQPALVPA